MVFCILGGCWICVMVCLRGWDIRCLVIYRYAGEAVCDMVLASRYGIINLHCKKWSGEREV